MIGVLKAETSAYPGEMSDNFGEASPQSRQQTSRRVSTFEDVPFPSLPSSSQSLASDRFLDPDNSHRYEQRDDYPQLFSDASLTPAQISRLGT